MEIYIEVGIEGINQSRDQNRRRIALRALATLSTVIPGVILVASVLDVCTVLTKVIAIITNGNLEKLVIDKASRQTRVVYATLQKKKNRCLICSRISLFLRLSFSAAPAIRNLRFVDS